jgi:hypothetical protein
VKSDSKPEPKTRVLHFEEQVFICSRCECDSRHVYMRGHSWYCLPCLKDLLKQQGASNVEIFSAGCRTQARRTGGLKCLDVRVRMRDRRQQLICKGLAVAGRLTRNMLEAEE